MRILITLIALLLAGCSEKAPVVQGDEQAVIDKAEADVAAAEAAAAEAGK